MSNRYRVTLARCLTQRATIIVEADSYQNAESIGLHKSVTDVDWYIDEDAEPWAYSVEETVMIPHSVHTILNQD